jgi:hypothetical protein
MLHKKRITALVAAVAAVTAVSAQSASATTVQPYLVGGHEATGNTSWMAALLYDAPKYDRADAFGCGGTLIFRGWVVTNAHCVTDQPQAPLVTASSHFSSYTSAIPTGDKAFKVRVGSKDRTTGGELAEVTEIRYPKEWNWGTSPVTVPQSDIAMLKLDHDVNQQPIQLAGTSATPGDTITLYGWGADQPSGHGTLPTRLQQLETTVLRPAQCAAAGVSPGEICTDNPHGTDGPGGGDSGGPAVKMVRGVAQLVGGCSRAAARYPGEAPTVYTNPVYFRKWLYDTARGVAA